MVWSSAARNSASATPTVARIRALRVISAGIGGLLGHLFDRAVEVRERHAKRCALVGGNPRRQARHRPLHPLPVAVCLPAPPPGKPDQHHPTLTRMLQASDVTRAK